MQTSADSPLTEQQQQFVETFCSRRGYGLGGPIQIRNTRNHTLFQTIIPSGWTAKTQLDHDSPTMVASMSKVVTGMAVVMTMEIFQKFGIAVGGQELAPDMPIHLIGSLEGAEFPDEFSRLDPNLGNIHIKRSWYDALVGGEAEPLHRPITFRHLLTHTSGLSSALYLGKGGFINDFNTLCFQPGDQFEYGTGYDVAGRALVAIWKRYGTGLTIEYARKQPVEWETLNDVVDALIFRPLGMVRSEFKDMHSYAEEEGWSMTERITRDMKIVAKQQYGGRDLQTTGNDISRFLVMLLNRGCIPEALGTERGQLKISHRHQTDAEWDRRRLMSENKFNEYVLRNHLPAEWDETDDSMVNKAWGGNNLSGMDHFMGYSLVAAVSKCGPLAQSPRNMFDLIRPRHGEMGTHLYWRGMMGSVWHVNYDKGMSFAHVTKNPERLARVMPRMIEGFPRKTFTVNHDWLIGPLFPTLDELERMA